MITFSMSGDSELVAKLNGNAERITTALQNRLEVLMGQLRRHVKEEKLSGQVLQNRTGNLRNAVFSETERAASEVIGRVYVDKTAWYGKVHEFGAHIPEVTGKLMVFEAKDGTTVFTRRHRAFNLPERSFMRTSLREMTEQIISGLNETAAAELAK